MVSVTEKTPFNSVNSYFLKRPIFVSSIFLAVICAIFVAILIDSYRVTEKLAIQTATSVGSLVDQDISRTIELFNLSIEAVIEGLADPRLMALDPDLRQLALFDKSATAEGLGLILVLDKDGRVIYNSRQLKLPTDLSFADRDYFQVHRDKPDVGLYVSQPFKSRLRNGDWTIAISRRLTGARGEFYGVVMGGISLSYFQSTFRKSELGNNGTITLVNNQGIFLARYPQMDSMLGTKVPIASPQHQQTQPGVIYGEGMDGVMRLFAFHQLKHLPLIISVGISTQQVFGDWYRKAAITAGTLGSVCSLVLFLSVSVGREFIRRKSVEEELADLAVTDALTGVANRRRFNDYLEAEWARAQRSGKPFCMLMIDVDYFKSYNDAFGHQEGDLALQIIAACLMNHVRRPADLVARYGGEEFAVLLPGADLNGARCLGEAMRGAVEQLNFNLGEGVARKLTISVGLGMLNPIRAGAASDLIHEADRAVYEAKAAGRNCLREWASGRGRTLHTSLLQHT